MNEQASGAANASQPYYYDYNRGGNMPPQPPRRRRRVWPWIVLGILLLAALIIWAACTAQNAANEYGGLGARSEYIAVLHVEGTMSVSNSAYTNGGYDHEYLLDTLETLTCDPYNQALLLYINSGGGEVLAADELAQAILSYKQLTGRPVYAYGYAADASGAYWISCAADEIWLNRYCTTGSIGVTFGTLFDLSGLLEKYGIKTNTIASGAQKSMGSSFEEMSPETRAIFQSFIDEYYGYFIDWIVEQRGMNRDTLLTLADGRIYTATQAVANGLADHVGTYEECLDALAEDNDIFFVNVRELTPPSDASLINQLLGSGEAGELGLLLQMLPPSGALAWYRN